jgi:ribosomal protein S21
MKKRKNFRKRPKKELQGLQVDVYDGNVEFAIRKLKKMVKNSNLMMDLKESQYYIKPSEERRERINRVKSRIKYQNLKEKNDY